MEAESWILRRAVIEMRIAILTTDNREHTKDYSKAEPYFGIAPEALFQGFCGMADVEIHVISCVRQLMKSPEKLAGNIWFHPVLVPKFGWMTTLYQGCVRATRKVLREIQPDIVHGQGTERECAMGAVFSGFPNVITIHGNMAELARMFNAPPGSFGWLAARLETLCLRRTAGVFCNSTYTESLVKPRAKRTWQVANPLRAQFFQPVKVKPDREKCILLNIGLVSPRKRQVELLEVAERLHKQGLQCELRFIGHADATSPYAAEFFKKIGPLEKDYVAKYAGTRNVAELISEMDDAAGLLHFPSEEAFGLVVAEALARNAKFFGARLGGIIDITNGMPEAELYDGNDLEGLQRGIARWVTAGFPRAEKCSELARARYHPDVIARRHVEIYREVLAR